MMRKTHIPLLKMEPPMIEIKPRGLKIGKEINVLEIITGIGKNELTTVAILDCPDIPLKKDYSLIRTYKRVDGNFWREKDHYTIAKRIDLFKILGDKK
tara:strand:- start:157 stop:450 length:294 start_codon:yes stop_codon:yes gene_type:complete